MLNKYFDCHNKWLFGILLLSQLVLISACSNKATVPVSSREVEVSQTKAPVSSRETRARASAVEPAAVVSAPGPVKLTPRARPGRYYVKKGDTLYSIAWKAGQDYKEIARWNGIDAPYTIYPGQELLTVAPVVPKSSLKLQPGPIVAEDSQPPVPVNTDLQPKPIRQDGLSPAPATKPTVAKSTPPKAVTKPKKAAPAPKKNISNANPSWRWPTAGRLVKLNQPTSKKGIDIAGNLGQPVKTSAAGSVVYSGSGLLGYGKLIIIKHNDTYLSAYAHNNELLVGEGDRVDVGQTIAKMGKTPSGQSLLHFEIRKNGKPVNPLTLLPKR